ncbi:MAG: hypothetical protein QXP61_09270, partial [Nitrososphaerales archaeon]
METDQAARRKQVKYSAIALGLVLVTSFMIATPMPTAQAQVTAQGLQPFGCIFDNFDDLYVPDNIVIPEDGISMNTVVGNKGAATVAKTVHAEKQIATKCKLLQGGREVIIEQTIFAVIYKNMDTKQTLRKYFEVLTCQKIKDDTTVLGCVFYQPATDFIPTTNCEEQRFEHPQEMNTVVHPSAKNIVRTTEAQKEVFFCFEEGVIKKVDVILFTEIWQDLSKLNG